MRSAPKLTSGRTHFMVRGFPICNTPHRDGGIQGTDSPKAFALAAKDAATCCAKCSQLFSRLKALRA